MSDIEVIRARLQERSIDHDYVVFPWVTQIEQDAVDLLAALAECDAEVARLRRLQSKHHRMLRVTAVTCAACKSERADARVVLADIAAPVRAEE